MPTSWVAGSVRARLLANRRIGSGRAAELARSGSLSEALELLVTSPYGAEMTLEMSLEAAQRAVAANLLWNVRLIAGWLPPGGVQVIQPLAAWFELANIEERLVYLAGGGHPSPYQLGSLGSAWSAVSRATTRESVREALAQSRWGDPGDGGPDTWMVTLRFRWAAWVASSVPGAGGWAAAASALLAARLRFSTQTHALPPGLRPYGLGAGWSQAATLAELRSMLSERTAWILAGVDDPASLWRAEARWWSRVRHDAVAILATSRFEPDVITGAVALLAHDAWLTRAALAAVDRGDAGRAVFDAVA